EARDVRVHQACQDLTLRAQALGHELRIRTGAHQLDGDFLLVLIVRAHRAIDLPHAAGADLREQTIGAEAPPGELALRALIVQRIAAANRGRGRLEESGAG